MKKFVLVFMMIALVFDVFAKEKLSWGLSRKKIQKKANIELKYEDEHFEIMYLKKGSIYQNEFDEWLLFSKEAYSFSETGLIRRLIKLENTNYKDFISMNNISASWVCLDSEPENIASIKKELKNNNITLIPADIKLGTFSPIFNISSAFYEEFPKKYSFEIQKIFASPPSHIISGNSYIHYHYMGNILFEKDSDFYILLEGENSRYFSREQKYAQPILDDFSKYVKEQVKNRDLKKEAQLLAEQKSQEEEQKRIAEEKRTTFEFAQKDNPGPFGTLWGMKKEELDYIGKWRNSGLSGGAKSKYDELYDSEESITETVAFTPNKKSDNVEYYFGIFDKDLGLVQILCVIYDEAANTSVKDAWIKNEARAEQKYEKIKDIIIGQYGKPLKDESTYASWKEKKSCNIELIHKMTQTYKAYALDRHMYDFVSSYVWLIYSSADYEKTAKKIKDYKQEEQEKIKKRQQEENSYF